MMRRIGGWLAAGALVTGCTAVMLERPGGNPHYDAGKSHHTPTGFRNSHVDLSVSVNFWRWQWERWQSGKPHVPEGGWKLPLRQPDIAYLKANREEPTATWIGHATVLLQVDGLNILTDPIFSERASPVSFYGPRRWVPPAIAIPDLPHIDIVVISHNHYDHLDDASVRALAAQPGGPPVFYVPLGLGPWFAERGITAREMDWWDRQDHGPARIHLVPVQHWSARTLWDRNHTLWGGFVIEAGGRRLFFSGDTGYSPDFVTIGERFGSFDLALLPIGAYEPRWFMSRQHVDPAEAVRIHRDLRAKQSLAIHWGTFLMADEPLDEPPRELARALDAQGVAREAFWIFEHGETRRLGAAGVAAASR